jgi:transposase
MYSNRIGQCETITQAPVPEHVIDKGLPTTGLLAQVLVAKYGDHVSLYRQERIFERAGLALPRSPLAQCQATRRADPHASYGVA